MADDANTTTPPAIELQVSAKDTSASERSAMRDMLAISTTLGFFAVLFTLMFVDVSAGAKDVLLVMLGALTTAWIAVITFYFGSSASSVKKDATIANLTKQDQ